MKMFNEKGDLSEESKRLFIDFNSGLEQIMSSDTVSDMSENELRLLASNLNKIINETITNRIVRKNSVRAKFNAMTDEEFYAYLQDKYGEAWRWHGVSPEEQERFPVLTEERIRELLVEGAKNVTESPRSGVIFPSKTGSPWFPKDGPRFK